MASILAADIAAIEPKKALDAGAGELRTFPLFPAGSYTGIVLDASEIAAGLTRQAKHVKKNGRPNFVVTDLNGDFGFLGMFDLVVCTGTAAQLTNAVDTLRRLAAHVRTGGTMLVEIPVEMLTPVLHGVVADDFERVEVVALDTLGLPPYPECLRPLGLARNEIVEGRNMILSAEDIERLLRFAVDEMNAEPFIEKAMSAYIRCYGSRSRNR
jgi:hypothetical protein